ncbi:MAG: PEGA domain-containing protein [Patescibacteria group bacterium]
MSKGAKTFILIASFLSFFVLTYLIVLYAYGYQFNFEKLKWVETGGLLIKTNMDGVEVFIDGERQGKTSFLSETFVKKNLLPGEYNITLKKNGFPDLNKTIKVKSGEAVQLTNIYLPNSEEVADFVKNSEPVKENPNYFISRADGLLYQRLEDEQIEKVSSESVFLKNYKLKILQANIYLASYDLKTPGVFSLDASGAWEKIHSSSSNDLILSPDNKKIAIVGPNEISVLWLKNENEPPFFQKDRKELVIQSENRIKQVFWFKTGWHLIYLTETGSTHFVELDPTGGRSNLVI